MNTRDCPHGRLARSCETCADADHIRTLQGEARVLRRLLAEARDVLATVEDDEASEQLDLLMLSIDAALLQSGHEAQQMSITEASQEAR